MDKRSEAMAKTLISADPGALMKVADLKGVGSIKALSEKTGSDRKTLRAINDGRPVKDSTLKTIADRLRVPISHLRKEQRLSTAGNVERSELREIILQPLNAKLLRELIEALDPPMASDGTLSVNWILKIDQITNDLEAELVSFESLVQEWTPLLFGWDHWGNGKSHGLKGQLAKIKMATDVETHIQAFSAANLRLFGGNFVWWSKSFYGDHPDPELTGGLEYQSYTFGVIAIEPKNVTCSKHRIDHGEEPPPSFDEEPPPPGVNWVRVDNVPVYERPDSNVGGQHRQAHDAQDNGDARSIVCRAKG
jgi:hypothetical protein